MYEYGYSHRQHSIPQPLFGLQDAQNPDGVPVAVARRMDTSIPVAYLISSAARSYDNVRVACALHSALAIQQHASKYGLSWLCGLFKF